MRLSLSALSILLVFISALPVKTENICPDSNPENCYPKLFVASSEWQQVLPGQIIPVGLEVRMSLENDQREARISEKAQKQNYKKGLSPAIIEESIPEGNVAVKSSLEYISKFVDSNENKDLNDKQRKKLLSDLETLVEWSSDADSGVAIAHSLKSLLKLTGLYSKTTSYPPVEVEDYAYQVLSSTFRNNLQAQKVLRSYLTNISGFLTRLVPSPSVNYTPNETLIAKRKLGLLSSLLGNGKFLQEFKDSDIEKKLLNLYTTGSNSNVVINDKVMSILEDLGSSSNLIDYKEKKNEKRSFDLTRDQEYAIMVEQLLIENPLGDITSKELLKKLATMRKDDKTVFKPSNEFLDWLGDEINVAKSGKRELVMDLDDLIDLRHSVFGNRLGSRKEYDL